MLRILVILGALVLLAVPFLPIRLPFTLCGYNFPEKQRPKNVIYIAATLIIMLLIVILMPHVLNLADWFAGLRPIRWIMKFFNSYTKYGYQLFKVIFANVLFDLLILAVHAVCGGLGGLFAKDGKKSILQRLRQFFQDWKAKQQAKKAAKQQPVPQPQEPSEEALPDNLLPKPEKKDYSSKVLIQGVTEQEHKKKPAPVQNRGRDACSDSTDAQSGVAWRAVVDFVVGLFYEKRGDDWYVQPQCKKVAKHLRNFIILTGAVYLVMFLLLMIPVFFPVAVFAKQFYDVMNVLVDNCYLYPSVSLVVLTELFWFMNGTQADEEVVQVEQKRQRQRGRIVDLDKVEQDLMKVFGKDNEVKSFCTDDVGTVQQINAAGKADLDPICEYVASFVESQSMVRNDEYLKGIQALQDGADTLFDAPLYTAVGMYLYPYLSMCISRGERIVVVCQNKQEFGPVIRNLENGFKQVMKTHKCLWRIVPWDNYRDRNQTDVLVLTPKEFLDDQLFGNAHDFFGRVTIAVFPDADKVILSNNYSCMVMAERLRQNTYGGDVQYIFLSTRHTLNLAESLTEYFMLDRKVTSVSAEYGYGSLRLYVWKSGGKSTGVLDNGAKAVQMEVGIAKVAQANGVPDINLVSDNAIFPDQVDPCWLDIYDSSERPIGFAVVADDGYNLPGTIYAYSRYIGKQASVLHVICRPYLLRDYFFDRAARSLYEQPLMERGIVEHAQTQRSALILLLCRLIQGIPVEIFAAEVERLTEAPVQGHLDVDSLRLLAERCLEMVFGSEAKEHSHIIVNEQMDSNFRQRRFVHLRENGVLDRLLADTELVTLHFEGSYGRPDVKLNLFKRMLNQRYLEGQYLVYDNTNYHISRIDREKGLICLEDAIVVRNVPQDYVQVRHYTMGEPGLFRKACIAAEAGKSMEDRVHFKASRKIIRQGEDIDSIVLVWAKEGAEIISDTVSYFAMPANARCMDLTDPMMMEDVLGEDRRGELRRKVGHALHLKLKGGLNQSDRVTMTFAAVLQEMMKTLFPDQYFCISVCPILKTPDAIYGHQDPHCCRVAGVYPRLYGWGAPDEHSIEVLIVDDCQGGTGILDLFFAQEHGYLFNVLDMMSDYLQWQRGKPESYLSFGADSVPVIFDLEKLDELMQVFSRRYVREHDLFQSLQMTNCCEFCGKPLGLGESYLWDNRMNVCRECREGYVPTQEECGKILTHCMKFLEERFGISFRREDCADESALPTVVIREGKEVSSLDVQARQIGLAPELPLVSVHSELMKQLVRLWQIENLDMTGEPEFEGQVQYVLLQYLEELKQYQRRKRFHRRSLLADDAVSLGYNALRQALQAEGHDNSFRYMLDHFRKGVRPPVRKAQKKRSSREDPWKVRKVFAEQLNTEQRKAYDMILEGLMAMDDTILIDGVDLSQKAFDPVVYAVFSDNPGIFWADDRNYDYADGSTEQHVTGLVPHYYLDAEERQRRQEELEEAVPQFLEGITSETGDYEAALMVYERMAMELDYDSLALEAQERRWKQKNERRPRTKESGDLRSVYGALVMKKAVCAGYAHAYHYLMQHLGIECMYVRGDCSTEGRHGWNIVKLEGDYYHVDVTWGDHSNTDPSKNGEGFGYHYFCVTDKDVLMSRTIDKEPEVPRCTAVSCNYFVRSGLYFETYDHQALRQRLLELLEDPKRTRLDMRFANAQVLDAARRQLAYNGGIYEILRASGRSEKFTFSGYDRFNIFSIFFEEGKAPVPQEPQEDPQDDPQMPSIEEPD